MVIRELISETALALSQLDNHMFEAHLIVRQVLGLSPIDLVLSHKNEVSKDKIEEVRSFAKRRSKLEPLQYILGTQEFMGLEFEVRKNVLIPRADTEALVEEVLKELKGNGASILDLCSGSGCIGLALCRHNKRVYLRGVDISPDAIELSRLNAEKLGVADRAIFEKADILNHHLSGKYDVIVSNPPYIRTDVIPTLMQDVKDFEPHLALDGGKDGLVFYNRIIKEAQTLLHKNGLLAFEIGFDQGDSVSKLMKKSGFSDVSIVKDLCGNDRVVTGRKC